MSSTPIIVASVCTLIGLGMFAWAYFAYLSGKKSLQWPEVEGTVTSSSVTTSQSDNDSDPTYYPSVSYGYQVGGQAMESSRFGVGGAMSSSQSGAAAIAAEYPVGKKVRVYYDPANPSYGVLRRGSNMSLVGTIAAGGAIVIAGGIVAMIVMAPRH